jgi:hypothetical protein
LNISKPLGKSPHDYFLSRHEIGHPRHIVSLFGGDVLPSVLLDKQRIGPRLIIANTGTLRFDLVSSRFPLIGNKANKQFQGRFDQNDQLTVSPLYVQLTLASYEGSIADPSASAFLYTTLPAGIASNSTGELNRAGASRFAPSSNAEEVERKVDETYNQWMAEQWFDHISRTEGGGNQAPFEITKDTPTMGYVTRDSCPGKGDDIEHVPGTLLPLSRTPLM